MTECIDPNDIVQQNKSLITTFSGVSSSGSYTLSSIDNFTADFESNMSVTSANGSKINSAINIFGNEAFYTSLRDLTAFIASSNTSDYENLNIRASTQPFITPIEYAEFITEFAYTPVLIQTYIGNDPQRVLSQLEEFYTKNFTQSTIGAFCSLMPKVFAAIDGFFDAVDFIQSFSIAGAISKLTSGAIKELLKKISDEVLKVIDKVADKVRKIIENFSIEAIFGRIETYVNTKIISKIAQLKTEALEFFSIDNLKKLKERVRSLISYAVNVFKAPTLEEIQFLVYRFCSFASQVENSINAIPNSIAAFAQKYDSTYKLLRSSSNINTSNAVSAGAIRYTPDVRAANINEIKRRFEIAGNFKEPTAEELSYIGRIWNEGKGDPGKIIFSGNWISNTYTLNDVVYPPVGAAGWNGIDSRARVMLTRVQKRFGREITMLSGLRPQTYNDYLRSRGVRAAKNSLHIDGGAIDVRWSGFSTQTVNDFIAIAREENFTGFGIYSADGFVHVDIGNPKTWRG